MTSEKKVDGDGDGENTSPSRRTKKKAATHGKSDPAKPRVVNSSPSPRRQGLFGPGKARSETKASIDALASTTGTDKITLGAIKAAYAWTDRTRLKREEFTRLRNEWLNAKVRG